MKNKLIKFAIALFVATLIFQMWVTYRLVLRVGLHEAYIINIVKTISTPQAP